MKEVFGLDVGTSRLVLARRTADNFLYESQLNAFVTIPYAKMTEVALKNEHVPYSIEGAELIIHGNESARFADLLQLESRRPMTRGFLNNAEPESGLRLRQMFRTLLPAGSQGRVYYSVPAAPAGEDGSALTYHEATIRQMLAELGYEATPINEGLAVIYGELAATNYSGIGVSFGGGLVNVCLAYLSVPVVTFAIPKGGDFVDQSTAAVTGELATRVRIAKEAGFYFNGSTDKMRQVLTVYYDDMIKTTVAALREAFLNSKNLPKLGRPIPLVVAGGSAMPKGFRDRFERALKECDFPVKLSDVRLAASPLHATAKGALVAALADVEEPVAAAAAAGA